MAEYTKYEQAIEDKQARAKYLTDKAVEEGREMTDAEVREHEALYGGISELRTVVEDLKDAEIRDLTDRIAEQERVKPAEDRFASKRADNEFFRSMGVGEVRTLVSPEQRAWGLYGTSSGASGLASQDWFSEVQKYLFESSVPRQCGMRIVTMSHTTNVPVMTAYGSGAAAIVAENTAYTADDPTVSPVQWGSHKFTKKVAVAEEVFADAEYDVAGLLA